MIKAVIFDIDDTLTTKNSWNFLATSLGVTDEQERENWQTYRRGGVTQEQMNKNVLGMWRTKGLATKDNFTQIFSSIPLRPDTGEVMEYLKDKNKKICLITGSMDMYAEIIAKKFGIADYYANAKLIWDRNDNIVNFDYDYNQAELKLRQFREFCQAHQLVPQECAVVGDSDNDTLLFLETKQGIAVRTPAEDKALEKIAWKIVDNLLEIKNILK